MPTQLGLVAVSVQPKLRYKRDGKKHKVFGYYDVFPRVIRIDAAVTPVMQWQTLFHEWIHVVLSDAGLHNAFTEDQQEVICDTIATARVVELLAHLK